MALFDMFKKKECSVCGEEIKFLGNRKLEDGNLCKHCANKLSPWFDDRRHSTVEQIKEQLVYREANREKVAAFQTTQTIGRGTKLLLDETAGCFLVSQEDNLADENPDVIPFSDVTGCDLEIDESCTELMRSDKDGNEVSYVPPRYEYSYDFNLTIHVNHPYFDEIQFTVNDSSVDIEHCAVAPVVKPGMGTGARGVPAAFNPEKHMEYRDYRRLAEQMRDALLSARNGVRDEAKAAAAPKTPVVCPRCGATTLPNARGCCEYCDSPVG